MHRASTLELYNAGMANDDKVVATVLDRRKTSMEWPVAVDERLRLLTFLAVREHEENGSSRTARPSAVQVLTNLILNHPLTGVAYLADETDVGLLVTAAEVNQSYAWVDREPWLGRPRSRVYSSAERIVRSRTKGSVLPPGAVSVTRPSRWGNPFALYQKDNQWFVEQPRGSARPFRTRKQAHIEARDLFRRWLDDDLGPVGTDLDRRRQRILTELGSLRGRPLACYCPLELACHADELLLRANPAEPE